MKECKHCLGDGFGEITKAVDDKEVFDLSLRQHCDGSGYVKRLSLKDKVNWVVLLWGYFCLTIFIYAILFGGVSIG